MIFCVTVSRSFSLTSHISLSVYMFLFIYFFKSIQHNGAIHAHLANKHSSLHSSHLLITAEKKCIKNYLELNLLNQSLIVVQPLLFNVGLLVLLLWLVIQYQVQKSLSSNTSLYAALIFFSKMKMHMERKKKSTAGAFNFIKHPANEDNREDTRRETQKEAG